jgi:hypothetical protein
MSVLIIVGVLAAFMLAALLAAMIADLTWWKCIVLVAAAVLVGGYFVVEDSDTFHRLYWRWSLPAFPPDETSFIAVADQLRGLRREAAAGSENAAALRQTEARLCALPMVAENWIGRVDQMFSVSTGEGVSLAIDIWPYLVVRTAFFPDHTGTLIRAGSPLFAPVSSLRQGDVVRFSGRIVGHSGACPDDPPVDENEKLRDPEFLLRFAQVAKAAGR